MEGPEKVIGDREKGEQYVWLGALSGWTFLRDGSLMHRCGYYVTTGRHGTYLANFIVDTVLTHRCIDWIEYQRQEYARRHGRKGLVARIMGWVRNHG